MPCYLYCVDDLVRYDHPKGGTAMAVIVELDRNETIYILDNGERIHEDSIIEVVE